MNAEGSTILVSTRRLAEITEELAEEPRGLNDRYQDGYRRALQDVRRAVGITATEEDTDT